MKTGKELYQEHMNRILTAVSLGKPDRPPVAPCAPAFCAKHVGVKLSEVATNAEISADCIYRSAIALGDVDAVQHAAFITPLLSTAWLSKIKVPGKDLPENVNWQVVEEELMKVEDYDAIINKGYGPWFADYMNNRIGGVFEQLAPIGEITAKAIQRLADAGIVTLSPAMAIMPYELFCGGRTMPKFMQDLFRIPDKVQEAMDAAMPDIIASYKQLISWKPVGAWVGGWRAASDFISPKLWQRFVWPYYKKLVEVTIESGVIPILHLDSNWERDLEYFRELPKAKCVFATDSSTNIYKVKEVLGDMMCIMGDVPPAMLTIGTPDEVYSYVTKLINEIGPAGYIVASGCDIPFNAKVENVEAMVSAVTGK
jgi:uroporphyrinogen-III decarboxylase